MPECNYCTESFDDEEAYLTHLSNEHADELGPIDRRRVETPTDEEGFSLFPFVAGASLLAVGAVVVYVSFFMNSATGSANTAGGGPSNIGSDHYHGPMTMTVDGQRVDFSQTQYQLQSDAFHFEGRGATAIGGTFMRKGSPSNTR